MEDISERKMGGSAWRGYSKRETQQFSWYTLFTLELTSLIVSTRWIHFHFTTNICENLQTVLGELSWSCMSMVGHSGLLWKYVKCLSFWSSNLMIIKVGHRVSMLNVFRGLRSTGPRSPIGLFGLFWKNMLDASNSRVWIEWSFRELGLVDVWCQSFCTVHMGVFRDLRSKGCLLYHLGQV